MYFLPNFRVVGTCRLKFAQEWLSSSHSQQSCKSVCKKESAVIGSIKRVVPLLAVFQAKCEQAFRSVKTTDFSNLNKDNDYDLINKNIKRPFTDLGELLERVTTTITNMSSVQAMAQLENNAQTADNLIQEIYSKLAVLQSCNPELGAEVQNLLQQNEALQKEVDNWKEMLILKQIRNGGNPIVRDPKLLERATVVCSVKQEPVSTTAPAEVKTESAPSDSAPQQSKKPKKDKNAASEGVQKENKAKSGGGGAPAPEANEEVDIGRLDLRIGLIKECSRHPDADALYVEKIDVGEANVRTVISGLVKHVPLDAMQNRMVVVLCNLKPSKMRGITSEAMVMCASTPEKVEIMIPPPGSAPGDVIEVDGFVRRPDAVLNPKKKIFEAVAPDLKTNGSKQATYKGAVWTVPGKGPVVSESLCNVNIK